MEWKRSRILRLMNKTPLCYCISIFFLSSLALLSTVITTKTTPCLDIGCLSRDKADLYIQVGIRDDSRESEGRRSQILQGQEGIPGLSQDEEVSDWAGIVAATVHVKVRQVHTVQAGARASAARNSGDHRILPGGLAVQVWEQVVHALAGA